MPGSCPAVSLAPKDHLTWLCDSVCPASSQVQGHPPHSSESSPCLVRGITVLLPKDVMEPVPPADMKAGFFSPYITVPKKSGGLRPILGLRILNWAFHKPDIRPQVWSAAFDLKEPYFHVSILPRHRPFLRFAFEGRAYQYKVLPFGLSLSPRVFTKVAEAALVPLREQGVRILNYLDDWLILAQSQDQLCEHRDLVLLHLSQLGLRVNWEKSKLLPTQRISFLGMLFGFGQSDSTPHAGTRSVGVELLEYVQEQDGGTTETVSEAPGAYGGCIGGHATGAAPYETASTLAPWPSPEVGVAERHAAGPSHSSLPPNLHLVVRPFVPSDRSAPGTGLQARCGLHRCLRQGLGGHVQRACSVGGLDGSPTALVHQLPRVAGSTPGLELSRDAYEASTYWSVQTALQPSRTSTDKVVYAPVACRN